MKQERAEYIDGSVKSHVLPRKGDRELEHIVCETFASYRYFPKRLRPVRGTTYTFRTSRGTGCASLLNRESSGFTGDCAKYTTTNIFQRIGKKDVSWRGIKRYGRSLENPMRISDRLIRNLDQR